LKQENATIIQEKVNSQSENILLSYKKLADKGKHLNMVSAYDKKNKVKAPKFVIEIADEGTDLEVTIEGSDHLYGSTIQIIPEDHAGVDLESNGSFRGLKEIISKVFGNTAALAPAHVSSPKHMTKYRFMDLVPGRYVVHLWQPAKPSACINVVDVLFQVTQSLESVLVERFTSGKSQ